MTRIVIVVAVLLSVIAGVMPARAHDPRPGSASSSSVFPVPRDPWRSWGVRHDLPQHVGHPRVHDRVFAERVWVPQQWVWDGAAWVWWPGGWVR